MGMLQVLFLLLWSFPSTNTHTHTHTHTHNPTHTLIHYSLLCRYICYCSLRESIILIIPLSRVFDINWNIVWCDLINMFPFIILWPPHVKSWLIGKDPEAGRDWGQEEKGTTEDEMAGWHHWFNGHEFEETPGDGDGQGGLACCDSWGRKESDTTERLNWTELL